MRGEISLFVLLARCEGKGEPVDAGMRCRCGARASEWAHCIARREAVPVPTRRLETGDLAAHAVSGIRHGAHDALLNDIAKSLVARDFPAQFDRLRRHAA